MRAPAVGDRVRLHAERADDVVAGGEVGVVGRGDLDDASPARMTSPSPTGGM